MHVSILDAMLLFYVQQCDQLKLHIFKHVSHVCITTKLNHEW